LSKSSFVLRALKILGLEEMLKLSEILHAKEAPLKMAAGEELIAWNDASEKKPHKTKSDEGKVLAFPKKTIQDMARLPEEETQAPEDPQTLFHSDLVLWQREISKQSGDNIHRQDAFKGYKKSTEMYVVKESSVDGKDKIRFASTNGVLVNKKQA
jgi:hypothetical protein